MIRLERTVRPLHTACMHVAALASFAATCCIWLDRAADMMGPRNGGSNAMDGFD